MEYRDVVPARFVSRPNRFIAHVEINGEQVKVHVKNTGRCKEILVPGADVYLVPGNNPARSTPYDLVAVRKGDLLINIDSQAPNIVAKEYAEQILGPCESVSAEFTKDESRFDIHALQNGRETFMEVKGVTLEYDGVVSFPDAPTERGLKHVRELTRLVGEGYRCVVCFIIQMDRARYFIPHYETDPDFGNALKTASDAGVEVLAFSCDVTPGSMKLKSRVEVRF